MQIEMVYVFIGMCILPFLWKNNKITQKTVILIALLTTVFGFIFLAPMIPYSFCGLVHGASNLWAPPYRVFLYTTIVLIILSLVSGRIFCGHLCPIGAIQELMYRIPIKKFEIRNQKIPRSIRMAVFIGSLIGGIYFIDVFSYTGAFLFFGKIYTNPLFYVFTGICVLSIFTYRPLCRFFCPFGLLFATVAKKSVYCLARTDACINCGRCEKVCPTGEAGEDASKAECYLCGRCLEICPVDHAIVYKKR